MRTITESFRRVRLTAIGLVAGVVLICLSGCHTIEGAGQDVSALGRGVSNLAADANPARENAR